MEEPNDFQMGVDYMLYKLDQAYYECEGDLEKFGQKVHQLMNSEMLKEAYNESNDPCSNE